METITLELIREGAPEGQILSALTRYFALCGRQAPEAFMIPLEHLDFVRRREALRAAKGEDDDGTLFGELRRDAIDHLARDMTRLMGGLNSLAHEVSATPAHNHDDRMIHLRVVLQPLELAALPIELAESTRGMPGVGQPLCIQNERPVVITRESHRLQPRDVQWPEEPRVLFAWSAPDDANLPDALWRAHLAALTGALKPWLVDAKGADQWLRIIPNATVEMLRDACASDEFTHVHLLAHGVEREGSSALERRLALAFTDGTGKLQRVDGAQLASALAPGGSRGHRPTVVTVASCDAGQVGSILGGGASLAHHLHAEGIPLVVASQLPMSYRASVVMTEVLYNALLQGDDPRCALHALRRRLRVEGQHAWEWASVVTYAALPANIAKQLRRVKAERMHAAIDLRLERVAAAAATNAPGAAEDLRMVDDYVRRFDDDFVCDARSRDERARAHDYLGSVALRWIDVRVDQALAPGAAAWAVPAFAEQVSSVPLTSMGAEAAAMRAQHHFKRVLHLTPEAFWADNVVNELEWLLSGKYDVRVHDVVQRQAIQALTSDDAKRRSLGRITLLSLALMAVLIAPAGAAPSTETRDAYESIVREAGPSSYEAFRARRVVHRFERWSSYRARLQSPPDEATVSQSAFESFDPEAGGAPTPPPRPTGSVLGELASNLLAWSQAMQVPARWPTKAPR